MRYLPHRTWVIVSICLVAASLIVFTFSDTHSPVISAHGRITGQKPLPPIDLKWVLEDVKKAAPPSPASSRPQADFSARATDSYTAEGRLVVRAQKTADKFFRSEPEVQITITTRGGITVGTIKPIRFKLQANNVDDRLSLPYKDEVPLTIPVGQRGTIEAEATASSPDGKEKYGRRVTLYLLADQRKLYNGSSGFLNLELQKLKDDLADRIISQEKFQQEMDRLLGGGAVQSDTPTP